MNGPAGGDASYNIVVAGTGGQGVMTASEVLAQTALAAGFDVKKTEVAGMAQRGGSVNSHVRFGREILCPSIAPGDADLLLAMEPAEGLRWIGCLKPKGAALVNLTALVPPVVATGAAHYPEDPLTSMKAVRQAVQGIDATDVSRRLGEPRLVNMVMLGAASTRLPFDPELLAETATARFRQRKKALAELNLRAFKAGQELARISHRVTACVAPR